MCTPFNNVIYAQYLRSGARGGFLSPLDIEVDFNFKLKLHTHSTRLAALVMPSIYVNAYRVTTNNTIVQREMQISLENATK